VGEGKGFKAHGMATFGHRAKKGKVGGGEKGKAIFRDTSGSSVQKNKGVSQLKFKKLEEHTSSDRRQGEKKEGRPVLMSPEITKRKPMGGRGFQKKNSFGAGREWGIQHRQKPTAKCATRGGCYNLSFSNPNTKEGGWKEKNKKTSAL